MTLSGRLLIELQPRNAKGGPSDFSLQVNDADANNKTNVTSCTASGSKETSVVPVSKCSI